jgi:ankyrin repeat protein
VSERQKLNSKPGHLVPTPLPHLDLETQDDKGRTPLLIAACKGEIAMIRQLLDAGAAVDARSTAMNITPLMGAANTENAAPLVRLLLEAGADPNAAGRNGAGALARAILGGDVDAARMLLDAGADPRGVKREAPPNTTPIWAAVALKRREMVDLLLSHGAEVNIGDSVTGTLFGEAVNSGDAVIARKLLEAGADPSRPGLSNLPLQAVALRFINPSMAQLLEEYNLSLAKSDI